MSLTLWPSSRSPWSIKRSRVCSKPLCSSSEPQRKPKNCAIDPCDRAWSHRAKACAHGGEADLLDHQAAAESIDQLPSAIEVQARGEAEAHGQAEARGEAEDRGEAEAHG